MEKNKEIGIFLIPNKLIQEQSEIVQNNFIEIFNKKTNMDLFKKICKNTFHITLYQLKIECDKINELKNQLKIFSKSFKDLSFDMDHKITKSTNHIFWNSKNAQKNSLLISLHKKVVAIGNEFRNKHSFLHRIEKNQNLTKEQIQKVESFGIFWSLPGDFLPHITIMYDIVPNYSKIIDEILEEIPEINCKKFYSNSIAIGELGESGNVIDVIDVF